MHDQPRAQYDIEAIRDRLTMADVCVRDEIVVKRVGSSLVAKCPFHGEKSGSFVIGGRAKDRAHCFGGCGWNDGKDDGDIFDFWRMRHGCTFAEAVEQLASLCGVAPRMDGVTWKAPQAKVVTRQTQLPAELREKPPLPPMRVMKEAEIAQLAAVRGLSVEGVRLAAVTFRRVGFTMWPLKERFSTKRWLPYCARHGLGCQVNRPDCVARETWPSWCVTDDERRVGEFRRLDGGKFPLKDGEIKAWSTAGKNWPIGAMEIGKKVCVLLVEGGPDLLAAYHFLWAFGQLANVAVVAMLGASARIAEEALPFFQGKRVRICIDADEIQEKRTVNKKTGVETVRKTRPGYDASLRWTEQLTNAGAAVQGVNLEGLVRADGQPVKDLNDLALCGAEVLEAEEIREIFIRWEF